MDSTLAAGWLQSIAAILAVILAFALGRFFERRDNRRRKVIETSYLSTPLVNPEQIGPLSVSVDKVFLTGQDGDKNASVQVSSAYSFVINIQNIGIDHIDAPDIDIKLNESASIVQYRIQSPALFEDRIRIEKRAPNHLRITPDFLNSRNDLLFSIISINNTSELCEIFVIGRGITHLQVSPQGNNVSSDKELLIRYGMPYGAAFIAVMLMTTMLIALLTSFAIPFATYNLMRAFAGEESVQQPILSPIDMQATEITLLRSTIEALQSPLPTTDAPPTP